MIIKLTGATFSTNIGNISELGQPFTVTVKCSTSGATIKLEANDMDDVTGTTTATMSNVPYGTTVKYTVFASGYVTQTGYASSSKTITVTLVAVGSGDSGGDSGGDTGGDTGGDSGGGDTIYTYSSIPTSYMKEGYLVSGDSVQTGSGFFTIENIPVTPGYLYSSPKVRNFMYKKSDGTVIFKGGFGGKDVTMSFGKNVSTFTACYKYDDIQPSDANLIAIEPEAFGTGDTKTVDGLTLTMYGNSTSSATSPYYTSNSDYNYFAIIYDNVQPNVTYSAPFARNASVVGTEVTTLALGGASNATITTGADTTQIVITYRREDLEPAEALITIQN